MGEGKGVTRICVNVEGGDTAGNLKRYDTICTRINDLNKELYKNVIREAVKNLITQKLFDAKKDELTSIVENRYNELQAQMNTTDIFFGRDLYYGLNDDKIRELSEKKERLMALYQRYNEYEVTRFIKDDTVSVSKAVKKLVDKKYLDEGDDEEISEPTQFYKKIDTVKRQLKAEIDILKLSIKAISDYRKYQVSLIGNANAVSSFKTVDKSQLSAGFGILAYKPANAEFMGIITVAQVQDTVVGGVEDFGGSVLIPGVRRFSLLASYRMNSFDPISRHPFFRKLGFATSINVTPYNWVIKKKDTQEDSLFTKAIPAAFDIMASYNWLTMYEEGKDICITTDIGFSLRHIAGGTTESERTQFLGTPKQFYAGLIAGLVIKYNGLRAQFYAPNLFGKTVKGLTGGQVYASIGFIGSILNSPASVLRNKSEKISPF
jgi:hypothetical protein